MIRPQLLAAALAALALSACGSEEGQEAPTALQVQPHLGCSYEERMRTLGVKVVDAAGAPVESATVRAQNFGTGQTVTATTDKNGTTDAVGGNLGSGSIQVKATHGTRQSAAKQAEFVCGECGCVMTPSSVTLSLP
jgi:hypothetical protein